MIDNINPIGDAPRRITYVELERKRSFCTVPIGA
jgi:hypothetical protein